MSKGSRELDRNPSVLVPKHASERPAEDRNNHRFCVKCCTLFLYIFVALGVEIIDPQLAQSVEFRVSYRRVAGSDPTGDTRLLLSF